MGQLRRDLDLAHEPRGAESGGELGAEHLNRHLAPMFQVLGEIHRGPAAGAEFALNRVAVGERCREAVQEIGNHLVRWDAGGEGARGGRGSVLLCAICGSAGHLRPPAPS